MWQLFCLWSKPVTPEHHGFRKEVGIFKVNSQCMHTVKQQSSMYAWGIRSGNKGFSQVASWDVPTCMHRLWLRRLLRVALRSFSSLDSPVYPSVNLLTCAWYVNLPVEATAAVICAPSFQAGMQDERDRLSIPLTRLLLRCLSLLI